MRLPAADTHAPKIDALSRSFILTVQHLIERCLTFYMDREDCVKALAKHAGIEPVITLTVWKELEKANKEFFEAYVKRMLARRSSHFSRILEDATSKLSDQRLVEIDMNNVKGPSTKVVAEQLRKRTRVQRL